MGFVHLVFFSGDRTNQADVSDGAKYLNPDGTDGNGNIVAGT
jgi:hypothetical protein